MAAGDYLLSFSEKCPHEKTKQYIIECLNQAAFSVAREEFEGKTLLTVNAPFELVSAKVVQ